MRAAAPADGHPDLLAGLAGSLLFILAAMGVIAYALAHQIANPLHRFVRDRQRISGGDYSPIEPARRYRDEFSELAIAVNPMLFQLRD